ncbi:DUF4832 domain-containing protein [Myxosarcina sp. GI1]|uniref:DUF4832 domain-containing protein n=1 Tax=Myxosarcina sp. GI1 TaxID=1541065 RepID=UPI00068B8B69|nr:DUF4832 domain-containing protein [Myxosarcina sp. GI1]
MSFFEKYISFCLSLLLSIFVGSCQTASSSTATAIVVYQPSNRDFPNPERGLFVRYSPLGINPRPSLQLAQLEKLRQENITLARRIYLISKFREKPLSQTFLNKAEADLATARKAGIKIILRFSYNWLGGGPDAAKERILAHQEQLKPLLADNYDVIAYMEAGFIGYWGEWNRSSNHLRLDPQARKEILFNALTVLPTQRMVALRYTYYKRDALNSNLPLTSKQAFNGSRQARIGAHNDCFLANLDNRGTYNSQDPKAIDWQKNYLNRDNRYLVQGGELCHPEPDNPYDDCPVALQELARMRWSALNVDHNDARVTLANWIEEGCFEEIKKRLGYRFRLVRSEIPISVKRGEAFTLKFEIANDGWASPFNARKLEIILRDRRTGVEYYFPVREDPRRWLPEKKHEINVVAAIPYDIDPGIYEVLLNLPDPSLKLYNRSEYSIRLANRKVWEQTTGYNSLLANIKIDEQKKRIKTQVDFFQLRQQQPSIPVIAD